VSATVAINGREFRVGTWYGARVAGTTAKRRQFLGWFERRPGWVRFATPCGEKIPCVPEYWADWAGEEITP
jgi:hypothetical protein